MIPKVETCIYAIEKGVEGVVILDGKIPHAVLIELLTDHGAEYHCSSSALNGSLRFTDGPCAGPSAVHGPVPGQWMFSDAMSTSHATTGAMT